MRSLNRTRHWSRKPLQPPNRYKSRPTSLHMQSVYSGWIANRSIKLALLQYVFSSFDCSRYLFWTLWCRRVVPCPIAMLSRSAESSMPFAMAVSNAIGGVSCLTAFFVVTTSLAGEIVRA
uniref:LrgB family protein n=1 Tax=Cupriavidus ulmosensis TaxID=3065913 RepID=UPI003F83A394